MTVELKMLAWSAALGMAQVLLAAFMATSQRGLKWNAGNRDEPVSPVTGAAARADRASRNFLETFVFFAAVCLAHQPGGENRHQAARQKIRGHHGKRDRQR